MYKPLFYLAFASFIVTSCGGSKPADDTLNNESVSTEEKVDDTPIEASYEELLAGDIEEYRTVIFETYIAPLPSTMYFGDNELSLNFYPRRHQTEGEHLRVDIREGNSKNTVKKLPEEYYQDDLQIKTDDGSVAVVGDRVRITGTYSKASDSKYQYIDLTKIEKLDQGEFDTGIFESAIELTDEVVMDESKDDAYCYMEGTMELNMFMSSYDGLTYSVKLNQNNNQYVESAYIIIDDAAPSSMNVLKEGFSSKDFIIRDYKGNEHTIAGKKVKLYGTFNQLAVESKGIFNVEEIVVE